MSEPTLLMKYFVLKPVGNDIFAAASRSAMLRYASIIDKDHPNFAKDIRHWAAVEEVNAKIKTAERETNDQSKQQINPPNSNRKSIK